MKTFGRHLVAELYACRALALLDDPAALETEMRHAAERVGATVLGATFHRLEPWGVSGTVVIAESHLSVHTWPENGYVAIDVYTCGERRPQAALEHLASVLDCRDSRVHEILRGIPEELAEREVGPRDVRVESRWGRLDG